MKIPMIVLAACAAMFLVGCGVDRSDPVAVAKAMVTAQFEGDYDTICDLAPSRPPKEAEEFARKMLKDAAEEAKKEGLTLESITLESKDDNVAKVKVTLKNKDGKTSSQVMKCRMKDGKYYADLMQ